MDAVANNHHRRSVRVAGFFYLRAAGGWTFNVTAPTAVRTFVMCELPIYMYVH